MKIKSIIQKPLKRHFVASSGCCTCCCCCCVTNNQNSPGASGAGASPAIPKTDK